MVRTGRATHNFEDTIRYNPSSILERSLYFEQLKRFFRHVSQEQVKVVIFEDFLKNKHELLREICLHIGVDYNLLPRESINLHMNRGQTPKYPTIHILKNRFFRESGNQHYLSHLPVTPVSANKTKISLAKLIDKVYYKLNPVTAVNMPKIKDSTKQFLDDYFKRELTGINELIGRDVMSIWFD
jgi:hypothetical protein